MALVWIPGILLAAFTEPIALRVLGVVFVLAGLTVQLHGAVQNSKNAP